MKIYNTLTREKEEFKPIKPKEVGIYGCGVTPYKPPHLGHAMQAVIFDYISRYFEYKDFKVTYVRNYTDIDDKIVNAASKEGIHPLELSKKVTKQSDEDFDELGIKRADYEPKVSEVISEIISYSQDLIEKGYAYATDEGNVYFDVRSFEDYGKLSNQKIENLRHGTRDEVAEDKRDPLDFALWKSADESEELWDSPWGHGHPGWHIECSVMSSIHLGNHFDIHGGGGDLVFPHHENEIAQSEAAHDYFANYWIHNGLLMVGDDKMSKSLDNDISIRAWLEKYHPDVIKYLIISNHYRSHVQFNEKRYRDANMKVYQVYKTLDKARKVIEKNSLESNEKVIAGLMSEFEEYMDDDFNTVKVIAMVHRLIKEINKEFDSGEFQNIASSVKVINSIGSVLGLFDRAPKEVIDKIEDLELQKRGVLRTDVEKMVDERDKHRDNNEYDKADEVRDKLLKIGVNVVDGGEGSDWELSF